MPQRQPVSALDCSTLQLDVVTVSTDQSPMPHPTNASVPRKNPGSRKALAILVILPMCTKPKRINVIPALMAINTIFRLINATISLAKMALPMLPPSRNVPVLRLLPITTAINATNARKTTLKRMGSASSVGKALPLTLRLTSVSVWKKKGTFLILPTQLGVSLAITLTTLTRSSTNVPLALRDKFLTSTLYAVKTAPLPIPT